MENLSYIEMLSFEDGTQIKVADLPEPIRNEIAKYNKWTSQLETITRELAELTERESVLSYARQTAFNAIQQLAHQLFTQPEAKADEAPAPTTEPIED